MGFGSNPGLFRKMKCISKGVDFASFADEQNENIVFHTTDPSYFVVGETYGIIFLPIPKPLAQ
jgi:hypothetical protein